MGIFVLFLFNWVFYAVLLVIGLIAVLIACVSALLGARRGPPVSTRQSRLEAQWLIEQREHAALRRAAGKQ